LPDGFVIDPFYHPNKFSFLNYIRYATDHRIF
jgi:hypothetical protein